MNCSVSGLQFDSLMGARNFAENQVSDAGIPLRTFRTCHLPAISLVASKLNSKPSTKLPWASDGKRL
ncbi:hypothetical protein CDO27_21200 (plasmid) [Sinorhizobium meliloti]|nr:hypothetical protein CDO27_21200 [Sinorhizobium meliloti]CCM69856.1 hypothetical protein BN406_03574 [Sinorhizobium meliloti Rm41]